MSRRRQYEPDEDDAEVGAVASVPDYTSVFGAKDQRLLAEIASRHAEIDREMNALDKEQEALKAAGVDLFLRNNVKSVMVEGRQTTRIDGKSVSYPLAKLVQAGVTDAQLAKAKSETPWTSLKVGKTAEEKAAAAEEKARKEAAKAAAAKKAKAAR